MEKKILVYDDNGTESEEFRTMLAQLSSQFQGHGLRFRFKQIYNLKGGLDAWQEAGFQTVKVNTRALTPPLLSFTTSSLTAICAVTNVNTCDIDHIFFSFSDTGLRDIANGHWNLYRYGLYGRFFYGKKKKKGYSYRR